MLKIGDIVQFVKRGKIIEIIPADGMHDDYIIETTERTFDEPHKSLPLKLFVSDFDLIGSKIKTRKIRGKL